MQVAKLGKWSMVGKVSESVCGEIDGDDDDDDDDCTYREDRARVVGVRESVCGWSMCGRRISMQEKKK